MEAKESKIKDISAAENLRKVRTEKSTSAWLGEGIGGLMSNSLDRMRWAEARLEKIGEWMGVEEMENKNLDNFVAIFGC